MGPQDVFHPTPCTKQVPNRPGCSGLHPAEFKGSVPGWRCHNPCWTTYLWYLTTVTVNSFSLYLIIISCLCCNSCPLPLPYRGAINNVSYYLINPSINSMFLCNRLLGSNFMMLQKWRTCTIPALAGFEHHNRVTVLAELQRCCSPLASAPVPHSPARCVPWGQLPFRRAMNSSLPAVGAQWLKALWDPWG